MTKFEMWKRNARKRLRARYRGSLKQAQAQHQAALDALRQEHKAALKRQQDYFDQIRREDEIKYEALVKEVAQVRLEWGPQRFGSRFMLYVRMDESFIHGIRDLKTHGPYVVDKLAMLIKREFAQIDFSRIKPITPKFPPGRDYFPTFVFDEPKDRGL